MAATGSATIKTWFETGDTPTQTQFADFIDSFSNLVDNHLSDGIEVSAFAVVPSLQSTAFPLTKQMTIFSNGTDGIGGALLPLFSTNNRLILVNHSINVIDVYPQPGEYWYGYAADVPYKLQPHSTLFVFAGDNLGWSIQNVYQKGNLNLPAKPAMVSVICGNSIAVLDQYNAGYAYQGSTIVSNFFAGQPMRFKRCTAGTRVDRNGNYGYSGATLATILPDLDTNWFPALATAGIVPDLVVGKALLENDINNSATYDQCVNYLTRWIATVRARWKNVKILLYTPHPAFMYDTSDKKDVYTQLRSYILSLDDNNSIFVTDLNFSASTVDPSIPQYLDFTASQTTTTLTVTSVASNTIRNGSTLFDPTTYTTVYGIIRCQLTGTPGGVGTYLMSTSATVASTTMRMSVNTDNVVHPNARGGVFIGREAAKTFQRMASEWVQPFYAQASNIIFDGTQAATGTGTSGTKPTGLTQANANGTFVETANQPYFTEVITASAVAPPSYTPTSLGANNTTSQAVSPAANSVCGYLKFIIVSGAINLREVHYRIYATDGSGAAFREQFVLSTNDADVDWMDGDVITFITPPEIPVSGTISAFTNYMNRLMKIQGGTVTIQYLEQGLYIVS